MKLNIGDLVRNGTEGPLYGVLGTVVKPPLRAEGQPERTWIRWDGNVLANGYPDGHEVLGQITSVKNDRATTTTVAQAISFAVDEVQEFGDSDGRMGLPLDRDSDEAPETALRVTEASAELQNRAGDETSRGFAYSQFTVKTSDGQEWTVRVTPKA